MKDNIPLEIDLTKIHDERGNLVFIENMKHIPFEIKRVYYIYDIFSGSSRGSHAHKKLHQLMIPVSGSFDVELDNLTYKKVFKLNNPSKGLYIPPGNWRKIYNFSSGAVCLVLASDFYNEDDYIRDFEKFKNQST